MCLLSIGILTTFPFVPIVVGFSSAGPHTIPSLLRFYLRSCLLENLHEKILHSSAKEFAYRRCGSNGFWVGRHPNDTNINGWTNYTPCFPALVQNLFYKVYDDEGDAQLKFETAQNTRYLEMCGYVISSVSTILSIIILTKFRALRSRRTFIHTNLFCAILLETIIRMVIYIDQALVRNEYLDEGIENISNLCKALYIGLEYSRVSAVAWMLIEGMFLCIVVSSKTLRTNNTTKYCWVVGWLIPALIIGIWVAVTGKEFMPMEYNNKYCWFGYNYLRSYWIIQGPVLIVLFINIIFLSRIMYVIVKKLQRTHDTELNKAQKTVRAALILLPLLGIVNIFNMFEYPLDGSPTGFAIWCYTTHFFRSFQGFFISVIYCFTNGEVIVAMRKCLELKYGLHQGRRNNTNNNPTPISAPYPCDLSFEELARLEIPPPPPPPAAAVITMNLADRERAAAQDIAYDT